MAKVKMEKARILGLKKDKDQILESLQRLEVIEIKEFDKELETFIDEKEIEADFNNKDILKRNINLSTDAQNILKELSKGNLKSPFFLKGRTELKEEDFKRYKETSYEDDKNLILDIVSKYEELKNEKSSLGNKKTLLLTIEPWLDLTYPMDFKGTTFTSFIRGNINQNLTNQQLQDLIFEKLKENNLENLPFYSNLISNFESNTYFSLIVMKKDKETFLEILRKIGFNPPIIEDKRTSIEFSKDLQLEIKDLDKKIETLEKRILENEKEIERIRFFQDYETLRYDHIMAKEKLFHSKKTFMIEGFIPKEYEDTLKSTLESKYNVDINFEKTDDLKEEVPVLLKNNGFSNPVEGVIESYSLPGKYDLDPTFIVSIFYYFMFGMMLSDAGYGFVIFIASLFVLFKYKDTMELGWKKTMKMYVFAGAFTIFWGMMFGSYFGDIFDVINNTFILKGNGTSHILEPMWFNPVKDPMRLLVFALIVGIIHLFCGMFMKALELCKIKDYKSLFKDVILWYMLLIGCLILLIATEMLGNIFSYDHNIISSQTVTIGKYLAIIGAIGIVLTNGDSKNPFVRFAQGLYSLYGISGYLSDVLSYSRLLALGLATGVIATVINMMGSMVATSIGGILGLIVFIIIMIFGHLFNLGINALGAYVHTNRLQYVEMFGKFYEGGGKKFTPLKMNTKYYKFKESRKNG